METKPIPNFPGYLINLGERVWSEKRNRWLEPHVNKVSGYLTVSLRRDGRSCLVNVHRLLLETFVGPCPEGMECRHLDGNRSNGSLDNLAWGTRQENANDRIRHSNNRGGDRRGLNRLQVHIIKHLLSSGELLNREIAKIFGVSECVISYIKNGRTYVYA